MLLLIFTAQIHHIRCIDISQQDKNKSALLTTKWKLTIYYALKNQKKVGRIKLFLRKNSKKVGETIQHTKPIMPI